MASARQPRTHSTGPRKNPLRAVSEVPAVIMSGPQVPEPPPRPDSPVALRKMMISEFCESLQARTNRDGRPFQEDTVSAYRDAAVALDAWMTKAELEADFTGCDTAVLNRSSPTT